MPIAYYTVVTIHVLAALFWLGGMFFVGVIGAPVLRAIEPLAMRQRVFQDLGSRFRSAGWIAIGTLVVTGILNLYYRGWLHWDGVLGAPQFWRTATGYALACKLIAVSTMIAVSAVHDFALGPRAGGAAPGSPRALTLRRRAALLARMNAFVGIVVVIAAVRLARS